MVNYVARAIASRTTRVSGTTLFHVSADYFGDASQWYRIAKLNGLLDPWIGPLTELRIPEPLKKGSGNGGILGV